MVRYLIKMWRTDAFLVPTQHPLQSRTAVKPAISSVVDLSSFNREGALRQVR
jgi:hypothetical protein